MKIPSIGGVADVATPVAKAAGVGFPNNGQPTPAPLALAPPKRGLFSSVVVPHRGMKNCEEIVEGFMHGWTVSMLHPCVAFKNFNTRHSSTQFGMRPQDP